MTMSDIINIFIVSVTAGVIFIYVRAYRKTDVAEPWYKRAWDAAYGSLTILWNYFVVAATGLVTILANVAAVFDPATAATIQSQLPIEWVAGFLILMALFTVATRLRSILRG